METGKTGRYFKYAIGEIVLVVIGILIALSINNWNEKQVEKNKSEIFILELCKTLIIQLQKLREMLQVWISYIL